jgi:hypothetical protein
MANLKVFLSSTCYDFNILRSHIRNFISDFGYDPVMSDYSDVLYDHRLHTHSSCVQEVTNCDILILIIGSRFGGKVIPKALSLVDIEKVKLLSQSNKLFDNPENLSITQLEVMKALERGIPIFTFVDSKVWHDHNVYEKNKDKAILKEITFPSIDKLENAVYIFEFINFIRHLTDNNSIQSFSRIDDIDNHLRKQWSGLFQRLLFETKSKIVEDRKLEFISNQISDIKAVVLSSISSSELKETAKGAIKFRRLLDLIIAFQADEPLTIIKSNNSWEQLLAQLEILSVDSVVDHRKNYSHFNRIAFIKNDLTFYICRFKFQELNSIIRDWNDFIQLSPTMREAIYNAVSDINSSRGIIYNILEHIDMDLETFKLFGEIENLNLDDNSSDER